jgi:hypothetical protein
MKTLIIFLTLAASPLLTLAVDVTGVWKAEFDSQVGPQKYAFSFKQNGTNLTGEACSKINDQKYASELKEGKVNGNAVSFVETLNFQDNEILIAYTGMLSTNGNEINFIRNVGDIATEDIVAKREPAAPTTLIASAAALPAKSAAIAGAWKAEFDSQVGPQKYTFTFHQDGTNLTGKATSEINDERHESELKEGKIDGDVISFVETLNFQDNDIRIIYTGKLSTNGNELKFTREVGDFAKEEIVARRE